MDEFTARESYTSIVIYCVCICNLMCTLMCTLIPLLREGYTHYKVTMGCSGEQSDGNCFLSQLACDEHMIVQLYG